MFPVISEDVIKFSKKYFNSLNLKNKHAPYHFECLIEKQEKNN